ncbi:MAG: O-methyltransferase [Chryseolinea sp.]
MDIINPEFQRYAETYTTPESDALKQINRDTYARILKPQMLSGHLQGRLLAMISKMLRPLRILEIGTYTGYSAVCLTEGLQENGQLFTIDNNEELEALVKRNFDAAGITEKVTYLIGNARNLVPALDEKFDLVFIDADKESYSTYFDLVIDKISSGGVIVADNVLRKGKVLQEKKDKDAKAIHAFNEKVSNDRRVEQILLPIRDGILMIRKLSS